MALWLNAKMLRDFFFKSIFCFELTFGILSKRVKRLKRKVLVEDVVSMKIRREPLDKEITINSNLCVVVDGGIWKEMD